MTANILLYESLDKDFEEKLWSKWLAEQPEGETFDDYINRHKGQPKGKKSVDFESIRAKAKEIERRFNNGAI